MAKKSKKQQTKEKLKDFIKKSFAGFELLTEPIKFKREFVAIKKESKHLRFLDVYDLIFETILENTEIDFVFFRELEEAILNIFYKLKGTDVAIMEFHQDCLLNSTWKHVKEKYYQKNEDVRRFDEVFSGYLSLYALSRKNNDLIEFREIRSRQIDEMLSENTILLHKSIIIWEKIGRIKTLKIWNGEIEPQHLKPLKKYKEE